MSKRLNMVIYRSHKYSLKKLAFFHCDRVGQNSWIRTIESKIRSIKNKDKTNGNETGIAQ